MGKHHRPQVRHAEPNEKPLPVGLVKRLRKGDGDGEGKEENREKKEDELDEDNKDNVENEDNDEVEGQHVAELSAHQRRRIEEEIQTIYMRWISILFCMLWGDGSAKSRAELIAKGVA